MGNMKTRALKSEKSSPPFKAVDPQLLEILGFTPKKSDVTKAQMVRAAIKCLGNARIEDLTFQKIGDEMGVRHSHVMRYFPDKSALTEAAIKFIVATWQTYVFNATKEISDPYKKLEASIRSNFDWIKHESTHGPAIGLLLYYSSVGGKYRELFVTARKFGLEHLEEILGNCLLDLSQKKLKQLARDVQHLITGKALEFVCNPDGNNLEKLKLDAVRLVNVILKSFA